MNYFQSVLHEVLKENVPTRSSEYTDRFRYFFKLQIYNIDLSHWYKVDKVFYTPEAKLRCVKITSYITKRS